MQTRFLAALALGATLISGSIVEARPVKKASFDGTWSVRLVTDAGACNASYLYTIAVQDGRVQALSGDAQVSGGVSRDGRIALGVRSSLASGDASGRLRAAGSGSGTWRVSAFGCTGRWTAHRHTLHAQS
jgi:hypothetical protein